MNNSATYLLGLLFLLATILFETSSQIFFNLAAKGISSDPNRSVLATTQACLRRSPWKVMAGFLCYLAVTLFWTWTLRYLPLSLAYPSESLDLVLILIAAHFLLGEQIGPKRWLGAALIIIGIVLLTF